MSGSNGVSPHPSPAVEKAEQPASREAEMALLGAMLFDSSVIGEASKGLSEDHFEDVRHKIICRGIVRRHKKAEPIDLVLMRDDLKQEGTLEMAGGADYLMALVDGVPNAANAPVYAATVKRMDGDRRIKKACQRILDIPAGKQLNGEVEALEEALDKAREGAQDVKVPTWEEITHAPILKAEDILRASKTAISYVIDPIIPRGYLTQIHGPPKGGKSTFTLYLSTAGAAGEWPENSPVQSGAIRVLYISWEDMVCILAGRAISYAKGLGLAGVPPNLHIVEMPDLLINLQSNADALRRAIIEGQYDLVVLDTLSHAHAVDEDRASEIKLVMQTLARIAKDTNSAIVYVHHRRKNGDGVSMSERGRGSTAIGAAPVSIIDWGDRGDTDITPVKVTGKLDYRANWEVEYIRLPDDAVRWEIREQDSSKKHRGGGQQGVLKALQGLQAAKQGPEKGVPGREIVAVMSDQGVSKTHVYRHLKALVDCGSVGSKVDGKSTFYQVTGA